MEEDLLMLFLGVGLSIVPYPLENSLISFRIDSVSIVGTNFEEYLGITEKTTLFN